MNGNKLVKLAGVFLLALGFFCLGAKAQIVPTLQAALGLTTDQYNTLVDTAEEADPIPAGSVPVFGNYWSAVNPYSPPLPGNMGWSAWDLGDGVDYLLDDLDTSSGGGFHAMDAPGVPGFGDGGDDTNYTDSGSTITLPDYGTNLWIAQTAIASGYLNDIASNTLADVEYEVQSLTNLLQNPNWQSEGFFYGSELTNWTPFSVWQGQRVNLFIRLRSWLDSYNIGIPDWWQIEYYGTNGIDPNASAGGDGYSNLQKFQMGLNPTNYYNPNGPPGFFGYVDATGTNVFIAWGPAAGPVVNYSIQRGVSNSLTGLYAYSQVGTVSSNTTFIKDVGAINNSNAWHDLYNLETVYPNSSFSGTDTWAVAWYSQYGSLGAPYGPPAPTNFYAYADTTATNVLLSWSPASGVATNYLIERGTFNIYSNAYIYHQIASVNPATNLFKVSGAFTNGENWADNFAVVAVYPGNVPAPLAASPINIGFTNGPAAPGAFYGYATAAVTNLSLVWTPAPGVVTNYVIFGATNISTLGAYEYVKLGAVSSSASTFTVTNGADIYGDNLYVAYAMFADYTNGGMSQAAFWISANGAPAPGGFVAYFDTTGTNVLLSWTAPTGAITGYLIARFDEANTFQYQVSSNATGFKDTNAVNTGSFDTNYTEYTIQSMYPQGGLSSTALAMVGPLPAPTSISAMLDATGKNVNVTWAAVPGAVSYVIQRGVLNPATGNYSYSTIGTVGSGVTAFTDTGVITGANSYNNRYQVEALFPGGVYSGYAGSSVSESSAVPLSNVYITANTVRNGSGRWQIMFSGIPTNGPQTIQLTWGENYFPYFYTIMQTNLSTTNLTGGIFQLPDAFALELQSQAQSDAYILTVTAQLFGPNGEPGQITDVGFFPYDAPYFVDGRRHMKQNLNFLLRAAPDNQLFFSVSNAAASRFDAGAFNVSGTTFEEFSFLHHTGWGTDGGVYGLRFEDLSYFQIDDLWPFQANYDLANYLATSSGPFAPYGNTNFVFTPDFATNMPAPAIIGLPDPYLILQPGLNGYLLGPTYTIYSVPPSAWGLSFNSQTNNASLASGNNLFGLAYNGGDVISYTNGTETYQTLSPGGNVTLPAGNIMDNYASWCSSPSLSLVNYYFAPLLPPENGVTDISGLCLPGEIDPAGGSNVQPYPVPIQDDFNVTNQTPLIIASVGQPMEIGGWAKYSVGSSGKFAYLGQYFLTNVFLINSNGIVTTNTAGVMSPYGEFFPLQAGLAQVATMPDIDSPYAQGTNYVRIISMNVDANHDGVMDFSYAGPDQNSPSRPFRFWVNDDQDSGDYGGFTSGNDGIPGLTYPDADGWNFTDQYGYKDYDNNGQPIYHAHGRRDLVDFFPVCLNLGSLFQSNALSTGISATDTNYQFILSQADGILRFANTSLTPTNYMNFLLDTNVSGSLAYAPLTTITATGVVLTSSFLSGIATSNQNIILIEAATATTHPLVLTIYHGTNQIAQTSLALSITGVEQMFRSKTMMLNPTPGMVPDRLTDASVPNEPDTTDKNFVFLHGYNVLPNEARGTAADVYKRMYWSGSHAKFWAVTWEGADSKLGSLFTPNYHTNVVNAFVTAPILATFITSLTNIGPVVVAAHSLGNMVTLSAISDWNAPISQYFMLDAAVPIEAIDPASLTNVMVCSPWLAYSNRLYASSWYQLFPTNDNRSTLSWNNRLGNLGSVDVYNFYSSGEEVLREDDDDPAFDFSTVVDTQVSDALYQGAPFGTYTWYWQEKGKGPSTEDWLIGSSHGGWKFSTYWVDSHGDTLSPAIMNTTSNSILQSQPMFDFNSTANILLTTLDSELLGSVPGVNPSTYAQTYRNRILSDAIPAMSLVLGANPVPHAGIVVQNTDMMTLENGWPQGRFNNGEKNNDWYHSDYHVMAYTFTHQLFDTFVTTGNLK